MCSRTRVDSSSDNTLFINVSASESSTSRAVQFLDSLVSLGYLDEIFQDLIGRHTVLSEAAFQSHDNVLCR
jgi:hypothetical protein